jgi:hypothetical protein
MENNILQTTHVHMVYMLGVGDKGGKSVKDGKDGKSVKIDNLIFTRTLPRYPAIIDIKFPTRRCNAIINKVASALYPLQGVPGTPVGLSAIEVLSSRMPKSNPRVLHLTETSCDMFNAIKQLTWDAGASIGEYIATYTGADDSPCIMHVKRDPQKWIALPSARFNPDAADIVIKELKLRAYSNIRLITARVDCVDDFGVAVLTACSLIGKRGVIAIAYSGHIMNNMIGPMRALASISGKFELIKPEASDDIWVVGSNITPPSTAIKSKLHEVMIGELYIGDDVDVIATATATANATTNATTDASQSTSPFIKFVAEFSQQVSDARGATNKFIESVASKYESASGTKFIPDMIADDIAQEYRTAIAEVSLRYASLR